MPNRYAYSDSGSDWFAQHDPGLQNAPGVPRMQTQSAPLDTTGLIQPLPPGSTWGGNQPGATTWQTPTGTTTSAVGGPDQFGGDYQKWFMALVGNRPWNQQTLNALMPTLQHYGINLTPPNASGDQTKIQLPNGQWVRVGFGEGHPVWVPQTDTQGNSLFGPSGPTLNPSGTGVNSPWAIPPPFQSPSVQDFMQNDPGLQARLKMGTDALEHSAAAQGSLLSGGFQKSLNEFAQNFGSAEYANSYNRSYQNYLMNYNIQSAAPWSRYQDILNRGLQATEATKTPVAPLSS